MAEGDTGAAGAAADLTSAVQPTDVAAAEAHKQSLINSPEWREKYLAGNAEARSEMAGLNAAIVAGSASSDGPDAMVAAFSVERAREFGVSPEVLEQVANRPPVSQEEYERVAQHKRSLLSDRSFVERLNAGDYDARKKMFLANLILSSPIKSAA
jgi:hypothetical protein